MGKIIGIDPWYDKQLRGCYGRWTADSHRKHRRRQNNTVCCGIYKDRRASGRRACKTSGGYKRKQNNLFYQERDGVQIIRWTLTARNILRRRFPQ